ncbi:uncharacterized protein LOC110995611 isoform X1 [Pieris rapae]|uniref:uncharacterized protein LOC110995611 isoform X1 n=1 Tax=Pieris rapae TaxID=64459 RepID=UPI001E27F522|nr:uncharacterized protein LOC110995611 isoform X1 [Pieris rapae]
MRREPQSLRSRLREEFYTYCAFWIAVSALPALALSYVAVRISNHLWLKLLSSRYPSVEFIRNATIRSLLDTNRNQGIINVLLCIKGTLNAEDIKRELTQLVIDRRDQNGELAFPRLRQLLVSYWGNYAWDGNVPFRPENHVFLANAVYRGRPVSDANIQDYISDVISKYFPSDHPPWQYIIIPCVSTETKYYILIRVHHLLLSGKKSLNIGDFLLMEQFPHRCLDRIELCHNSPLSKLFPTPSALPELWSKINESLSNIWNEFICEYDPVESPRALKTLPGAFHVAGLVFISTASALREFSKKRMQDRETPAAMTAAKFLLAIQRECKRRNLNVPKILISPLVTVDPRKWPRRMFETAFTTAKTMLTLPFKIRDEITAINELRTIGLVRQTDTFTWKYGDIAQLLVKATGETLRGMKEAYRAPWKLWTDTIGADDGKRHLLQTISLCGRKVASFSRPVPRVDIDRAARALGVSSTDIALFAATESLRAFFENAQSETPDSILVSARAACEDFLYTFAEGNGKNYKKSQTGGMVCLSIPVGSTPRRIASVVDEACSRQVALAGAWAAQARCGALTRSVPSPLARLTLNALSRRYAVSYAEINAPTDAQRRKTLWGQEVDGVVYWRPPQANISLSLTVIQYADTVRLTVMADARLTPLHTVPSTRWPTAIEQLVNRIDQQIARITGRPIEVPLSQRVQDILETVREPVSEDDSETSRQSETIQTLPQITEPESTERDVSQITDTSQVLIPPTISNPRRHSFSNK